MAQERIKWIYLEGTFQVGFDHDTLAVYDLKVIFPTIETATEVQRELFLYGLKKIKPQKLN